MKRWWANPEESIAALNVVDDSDVVNGVGVALLGYHGLSQKALQPLTRETLVDVQKVREVLSGIDLEPVAKALGAATKTVMGDASERYGQLLAEEIHKRATGATERLLQTWTSNGLPWPSALERAAEVHGVPLERLGRYATVMKSASVAPHVRADYADRELMAYASTMGKREATADTSLISKQQKVKFNEEDHPRNPDGEFRNKNATVTEIKQKEERLERLKRLNQLNNLNQRNLAHIKSSAVKEKQIPKEEMKQEVLKKPVIATRSIANPKLRMEQLKNALAPKDPSKKPTEDDFPEDILVHKWAREVYIPISEEVFEQIRIDNNGEFFVGELKHPLEAVSQDYLHSFIKTSFGDIKEFNKQNMMLMKSTETPVDYHSMENETNSHHEDINKDADYGVLSRKAKFKIQPGTSFVDVADPNDRYADTEPFPIVYVSLENADYEDFSKNLSGSEKQRFNEEHPRDSDGRFADKTDVIDLKQERLARLNRLNNLNNLNNQNRANQMKRLVDQQNQVYNKLEQAKELIAEQKLSNVSIRNNAIRAAELRSENPAPETDVELNDKFALVLGFDAPSVEDHPDIARLAIDENNFVDSKKGRSNVVSSRPFLNERLLEERGDLAFEEMINYVDTYREAKGWTGELKEYATDSHGDRLLVEDDETIADFIDDLTARSISDQHLIWQPEKMPIAGKDLANIAWVGYPKQDDIQVILGTQEQFNAFKNGNATLNKIDGVECLVDLMTGSYNNGNKMNIQEVFEETSQPGFGNVGTNPPVSAYVIKIGNNGK